MMSRSSKTALLVGFIAIIVVSLVTHIHADSNPKPITHTDIREAREQAFSWLITNITPRTGLFTYGLNPESGEYSIANNTIRQFMSSRILAHDATKNEPLHKLHRDNMTYILEHWVRYDEDRAYVFFEEKSKLGANALLLRALLASPFFEEYTSEAAALARGIVYLQNSDGSFDPWYIEPPYEYDRDYILTFYSGEALLALIEYYEKTLDDSYLSYAELSADYYVNQYAIHIDDHYYPAYVPWHTIALNKLYKLTGNREYAEALFIMNDKLLELFDAEIVPGRFYNPATPEYGRPHAASDSVYTEGLVYAYEIAELAQDTERAHTYKEALMLALKNLLSLQYKEDSRLPLPPSTYTGALRTNSIDPYIRVDNVQHAIDAFDAFLNL